MSLVRLINRSVVNRICQQFRQQISTSIREQTFEQSKLKPFLIANQRFYSLQPDLKTKLDKLVNQKKIVLFMKGEKDSPKCGFSNVITQVSLINFDFF